LEIINCYATSFVWEIGYRLLVPAFGRVKRILLRSSHIMLLALWRFDAPTRVERLPILPFDSISDAWMQKLGVPSWRMQ